VRPLRPAAVAAGALTLLVACAADLTPPPSASPTTAPSASTAASNPATSQPAATASTPAVAVDPGRPYDAAAVLEAMRGSTRPGGVPDTIETEAIAALVVEQLWTWDGQRYPILQAGAACGPQSCSLELSGTPTGAAGSDLYVLAVLPATSTVRLEAADLHGYPAALDDLLDGLVRRQLAPSELSGLAYAGATWQPPPDAHLMVVAYRSGGEEGSPSVDVVVDLAGGEVLEVREP
jgi:hypothetical protein